jgi:hypothetical protein
MGDRLSPEWVPHTRDQNQAILDMLGFVSNFWRLPSDQERLQVMEERMPPRTAERRYRHGEFLVMSSSAPRLDRLDLVP